VDKALMKKLVLTIALCFLIISAVALVRTFTYTPRQAKVEQHKPFQVDGEQMAGRLARALSFKTISHEDPGLFRGGDFQALHGYLEQAFPKVSTTLIREVINGQSLLYTWKGQDQNLKPIMLSGHIDVVPVSPGTEGNWTYPPFGGIVAGGYIWGRGALDMKGSVLAILESLELLIGEGFKPQRTIYLVFTHDEEVGGEKGAAAIAGIFKSRGVKMEYILDEGGFITMGMVPDIAEPVALVGTAEKGFVSVELTVEDKGGHSSMPPPHTAIGILATAVHNLENNQMPARISGSIAQMYDYLAPEMSFSKKLAFANRWLFDGLLKREFAKSPSLNSTMRTTTAVTMINGGVKANVLPSQARAVVNYRILPGDSSARVIDHVSKTVNNPRVIIRTAGQAAEPSPVSDAGSPNFLALQRTLGQVYPGVKVAPYLTTAVTNCAHYTAISDNLYRFLPIKVSSADIQTLHGTNERISVNDYGQSIIFYRQLILNTHAAGR